MRGRINGVNYQDRFEQLCTVNSYSWDFAMFEQGTDEAWSELYFSPKAAEVMMPEIILAGGVPCDKPVPVDDFFGLLVGRDESWALIHGK